jgi:hypothetical protein
VLHDLSATGFLIESGTPLDVGAIINLNLSGLGPRVGKVAWGSDKYFSGNFLAPLADEVLRDWLANNGIVDPGSAAGHAPGASGSAAGKATIPFNRPSIVGDEIDFVRDSIRRGQLSGDGHYTKQCNAAIQRITASPKALITHSCTAALEMAAILCDLAPGDEVIVPSFTFVSTANAIVMRGATPVFVDVDARTLNIDPARVEAAVTPRTKAIFAVHYAGFPADMDALRAIAEPRGLVVVRWNELAAAGRPGVDLRHRHQRPHVRFHRAAAVEDRAELSGVADAGIARADDRRAARARR